VHLHTAVQACELSSSYDANGLRGGVSRQCMWCESDQDRGVIGRQAET
jgi:hypothetical protein